MSYSPTHDLMESIIGAIEELAPAAILLFMAATMIEGLVYRLDLNRSWGSAMAGSLVANLASALVGVAVAIPVLISLEVFSNHYLGVLALFVFSFIASVTIEGFVIVLLYKQVDLSTWVSVAIANLASHIINAIFLIIHYETTLEM